MNLIQIKQVFVFAILFIPNSFLLSQQLDYIYVNPATGDSSGGHSALRVDEEVFHFQYSYDDQIFYLIRETFANFAFSYGIIQNRSIFLASPALKEEEHVKLRNYMDRYVLAQERQIDIAKYLYKNYELAKKAERSKVGDVFERVRAYGYFEHQHDGEKLDVSIFGHDRALLEKEKTILEEKLKNLLLENRIPQTPAEMHYDSQWTSSSKELEEITSILAALNILLEDSYLNTEAVIDPEHPLSEKQILWLQSYQNKLKKRIEALPGEDTPDRGYALLVSLARYYVIEKSIKEKKLYFLNTFPDESRIIQNENEKLHRGISAFLQTEWNSMINEEHDAGEFSYRKVEDLANRLAAFQKNDIRISFQILYPQRTGMYRLPEFKESANHYRALADSMYHTASNYEKKVKEVYSYGLIKRNCTTELLRMIQESGARIEGETVDPYSGLNFIPYYSMLSVRKNWANVNNTVIPSYRLQKLKSMKEKNWKTLLRESFAMTSSIYHYSEDDEWFIFFTDDIVPARPLFGTFNLVTGIFQTCKGFLYLPFDRGDTIKKGMKGILFSLPELIFWNFRKGSFDPFTPSEDGVPPYQFFQLQPLSLEAL